MKTVEVKLNSFDKVKNFVTTLMNFEGYFDLVSDKYVVDAKSIMGIFSMNLTKPLKLEIIDTNENMDQILNALTPFMA